MTIKELEERTGMTRANIRFYESEGLLSPARRENGYRDYSEEDVKTLEKIKLLRELHLDIDTIRLVQKGELPLERALFTLLTKLEGDKAALDRAAQVCRELERTGVEYGALEPGPWLEQLSQTARPQLTPPPQTIRVLPTIEEMEKKAGSHPWMRLLAREVDVSIYSPCCFGAGLPGESAAHWELCRLADLPGLPGAHVCGGAPVDPLLGLDAGQMDFRPETPQPLRGKTLSFRGVEPGLGDIFPGLWVQHPHLHPLAALEKLP